MRNLTRQKWKTSKSNVFTAATVFTLAALPAGATDRLGLAEPHLDIIPRTPQDVERIRAVTIPTQDFSAPEKFEARTAGATTVPARTDDEAFSQPSANLTYEQGLEFHLGEALFDKIWVFAPSSTKASDGLGPLYNARSCQRCHIRDGRGHLPDGPDYTSASTFLRVSIPGPVPPELAEIRDYIGQQPDPIYGTQLQDFSAPGIDPEYRLKITYEDVTVPLSGGETATLRRPTFEADQLKYGPLHPDAQLSPRVAPPMVGLGLIEAIPAADILAQADPDDADGDGISGRANLVWSPEFSQIMLGRFGHKASTPTIHQQSAAAFHGDIGISTPLFPEHAGECTQAQVACLAAPSGGGDLRGTEIDQLNMDLMTFYSRNIALPARRNMASPSVLRGKQVFYDAGCTSCHTPKFVTHRLTDRSENSFQLIWPYSDMLLHDMGDDLADNRPDGRATGREWRTAPLWGIGLTKQVSDRATYLHDGRARTLLEAILWHGGEAQTARDHIITIPPDDRSALIQFLESL